MGSWTLTLEGGQGHVAQQGDLAPPGTASGFFSPGLYTLVVAWGAEQRFSWALALGSCLAGSEQGSRARAETWSSERSWTVSPAPQRCTLSDRLCVCVHVLIRARVSDRDGAVRAASPLIVQHLGCEEAECRMWSREQCTAEGVTGVRRGREGVMSEGRHWCK